MQDSNTSGFTSGESEVEKVPEKAPEKDLFPIKIEPAVAGAELKKWLDFKRVKPVKRNIYANEIATLVHAIMYGDIEIAPDFSVIHNLNVPILNTDNKPVYSKLTYAPRINAKALNEALGRSGNESEIANAIAYGSALADLPVDIVCKLDTSDLSVILAISVFFV